MIRALVIPVKGETYQIELDFYVTEEGRDASALETLQAAVGGNIEAIEVAPLVTAYVNEEGKYACLDENGDVEVNRRATIAMRSRLFEGDFIAGPMVVAGFNPMTGEHRDLQTIDRMRAMFDAVEMGVER